MELQMHHREHIQNEIILLVERRMSGIPRECHRYDWLRSHKLQRAQLATQLDIDHLLEGNISMTDCLQMISDFEIKISGYPFTSAAQVPQISREILVQLIQEIKMNKILEKIINEKKGILENISKVRRISQDQSQMKGITFKSPDVKINWTGIGSRSFLAECLDLSTLHI